MKRRKTLDTTAVRKKASVLVDKKYWIVLQMFPITCFFFIYCHFFSITIQIRNTTFFNIFHSRILKSCFLSKVWSIYTAGSSLRNILKLWTNIYFNSNTFQWVLLAHICTCTRDLSTYIKTCKRRCCVGFMNWNSTKHNNNKSINIRMNGEIT